MGKKRISSISLVFALCAFGTSTGFATYQLDDGVKTEDYNRAGVAMNKTSKKFAEALKANDKEAMKKAFSKKFKQMHAWSRPVAKPNALGLQLANWPKTSTEAIKSVDDAVAYWATWRATFESVDRWIVKLSSIKHVKSTKAVTAVLRLEVVGDLPNKHRLTQRALFEVDFEPEGADKSQLKISAMRLIEGRSSAGPRTGFREMAKASGIDFYGFADARFLPPSDKLKFQTARHSIGGVSIADVNGDGADDVFFVGGGESQLYVNKGNGTFEKKTEASGLKGIKHSNVAIFGDFDNDGDQDLYVGIFFGQNRLYQNDGKGNFTDVTKTAGIAQDDQTSSLALIDVNQDGLLDIYVGRFLDISKDVPQMIHYSRNGESNRLYLNKGNLRFEDVTQKAGVGDKGLALGIAVADYDRDGHPDIYIANDFGRNVLYRNKGDGTFEDVAKKANALAISGGMSASFGDFDNDGLPDIYVSSIRSNQRWFSHDLNVRGYMMNLVQSDRRGDIQSTMLDLRKQLGDKWDKVGQHELAGNYLLRNKGDGTFEDVSDASNTRQHGWYWGSAFIDIDNDGLLDIYATNGWIAGKKKHDLCLDFARDAVESETKSIESKVYSDQFVGENSWNGRERNHMLLNLGQNIFAEVGGATGSDLIEEARGMAAADFDLDGDADIVINQYKSQAAYLVNDLAKGRRWFAARVQGVKSNRDGIGAEVVVTADGKKYWRLVRAGHAYASQFSLEQLFGLGQHKAIEDVSVRWPNGTMESFGPQKINSRVKLVEGQGSLKGKMTAPVKTQSSSKSSADSSTAKPKSAPKPWWLLAVLVGVISGAVTVMRIKKQP